MDRHCQNTLTVAELLEKHPAVKAATYPFLPSHPQYALAIRQMNAGGGVVTFELKDGFDAAKNFLDALQMILITSNLGDSRSIATHPSSTTHAKLTEKDRNLIGIFPGTIRLSVGLEDISDILEDISNALTFLNQKR